MHKKFNKCFTYQEANKAVPVELVTEKEFASWVKKQDAATKKWLQANDLKGEKGKFAILPNVEGEIARVVLVIKDDDDAMSICVLATALPKGVYKIANKVSPEFEARLVFNWAIASYEFTKYRKAKRNEIKLLINKSKVLDEQLDIAEVYYLVMDLVNTPDQDMYPEALAKEAAAIAKQYDAKFREIVGDDLLKENFPAVHAVGRSSTKKPRLIEINWGKESDPKVVLVGKGVCFDSGGFNMKNYAGMGWMKVDMGGGAHALAIGKLVMQFKLPVQLKVLVPAVENLVDSSAYKPGDVIKTRKGKSVEINHTDAEGRIILSDALAFASEWKPDVIIDFATLTGAAKVGLGLEIPALFTDDEKLAEGLLNASKETHDLLWRLPIYQPYFHYMKSEIADVRNFADCSWGGAITAALFLKEFVDPEISWAHLDITAFNTRKRPEQPLGAAGDAIRGVFGYLRNHYGK